VLPRIFEKSRTTAAPASPKHGADPTRRQPCPRRAADLRDSQPPERLGRVWHPPGLPQGLPQAVRGQSHTAHAPVPSRDAPGCRVVGLRRRDATRPPASKIISDHSESMIILPLGRSRIRRNCQHSATSPSGAVSPFQTPCRRVRLTTRREGQRPVQEAEARAAGHPTVDAAAERQMYRMPVTHRYSWLPNVMADPGCRARAITAAMFSTVDSSNTGQPRQARRSRGWFLSLQSATSAGSDATGETGHRPARCPFAN
jgi:hypothetical protein